MNAKNERGAGTGRRMTAGLVGSAALAGAGLAIIAGQAPAAQHAGQSDIQTATLTGSSHAVPPAFGGGEQTSAQHLGTAAFSGGAGASVPFNPDGSLGLANFFGLLNVAPPAMTSASLDRGAPVAADTQLAQAGQPTAPSTSYTITYPNGATQTFDMSVPPPGPLYVPRGSTVTMPDGHVIPLNDEGQMTLVSPFDPFNNSVPIQVMPMDKIPQADNAGGAVNPGGPVVVADNSASPGAGTKTDTVPPADTVPATDAGFAADNQFFSMLANSMSTSVKSIGEGMSTMADKGGDTTPAPPADTTPAPPADTAPAPSDPGTGMVGFAPPTGGSGSTGSAGGFGGGFSGGGGGSGGS